MARSTKTRKSKVRKVTMIDPTRTGGLRRQFNAKIRKQFGSLTAAIMKAPDSSFLSGADAVSGFQRWLEDQLAQHLLSFSQERQWKRLSEAAFRAGALRAYDDWNRGAPRNPSEPAGMRDGMRQQFVRDLVGVDDSVQVTANVFCATGPGGGVDPTCGSSTSFKIQKEIGKTLTQEIKNNFPEGIRQQHGLSAAISDSPKYFDVVSFRDNEGVLKGVASIWNEPDTGDSEGMPVGKYLRIGNIATSSKGVGRHFLKKLEEHAVSNKSGLFLSSTEASADFYKKAGFKEGVGATFYLTYEDLKTRHNPVTTNSLFGRAASKVKLLAVRAFNEVKAVAQGISNRATRVVSDAVQQNKQPSQVTRQVLVEVKKGLDSVLGTVQTETVRAYAAGQVAALKALGAESVTASVEWHVVRERDGTIATNVCKLCRALEGVIFTLEEAEGLIPRHIGCRCCWVTPTRITATRKIRKYSREDVEDAVLESRALGSKKDDWGSKLKVRDVRSTRNVFCPTGAGGGVDPSCSPHDSLPDEVKANIDKMGLIGPLGGIWEKTLSSRGVPAEQAAQMRQLFDYHRHGGEGQTKVDQKIADEFNKDTPLGHALRTQSKLEEQIRDYYESRMVGETLKQEALSKKSMREAWENNWGPKNDDAYDSWEHQWKIEEGYKYKNPKSELTFYRKGAADKDLIATSMNPEGAKSHTVGGSIAVQPHYKPTNSWTAKELHEMGYRVIGGFGFNQMGYSGEEEITWVKDKKVVANVFCPTGEGGGVDPSCEKHDRQPSITSQDAAEETFKNLNDDLFGDDLRLVRPLSAMYETEDVRGTASSPTVKSRQLKVSLTQDIEGRYGVRMDFYVKGEDPGFISDKLEPGTLPFLRKVREAAVSYRSAGFFLEVEPGSPQRSKIYEKALKSAGMTKSQESQHGNNTVQVWNEQPGIALFSSLRSLAGITVTGE